MNSRIRVLHIIKSLGRGGAETLLPETLRLHDRDKFEFHYMYFLPWKDQMVKSIEQWGGVVTCLPANNNIALILKARQVAAYIRKHKIQLVHAHLPWAGLVAKIAGKMAGIPVIYTEHNKQERYHFATRLLNLATMNQLTEVIAVSDDVAMSIRKHKRNLQAPVNTILNGVNTAHFNARAFDGNKIRTELGIPKDAPVIGTIAVFRFQKRLDLWMELAARILESNPLAHFVILGDGPLKEQLIRRRAALGLEQKIHMPGLQTEVRPYLAAVDVYMMSSVFEGLPIALLEAMSMGCSVVSTDAGGIKQVIRHELDGLLCSVDEPEKLVALALRLLADDLYRERLGKQARTRIEEMFSMEKMVGELENTYLKITG